MWYTIFEITAKNTSSVLINPLTPKSDWHLISPYTVIHKSHIKPLTPKISLVILITVCHTFLSLDVSLENLVLDQPIKSPNWY